MTEDWNPKLQALAEEYSPGYVITAFKVQSKLREKGKKGLNFTGKTESYMRQIGKPNTKLKVTKQMNDELRKASR